MGRSLGKTAELFNSMRVMEFIKQEIIMLFGPPQFAPSSNDLKFDCKAMQDFARRFNITWKDKSTYNLQGNGLVERMIVTLEKGLQKVARSESKEWDVALEDVLFG